MFGEGQLVQKFKSTNRHFQKGEGLSIALYACYHSIDVKIVPVPEKVVQPALAAGLPQLGQQVVVGGYDRRLNY